MKILALMSSYRTHGNTAAIVEMVAAHLQSLAARHGEPLEYEMLPLGHADLQPCHGCRVCFDRGEAECPLHDDLVGIKARMQAADGLLVASPIYVNDVNGIAKNWIDRLAHVCHRPEFATQCAYVVTTVGGGPTSHALRTLRMALMTWGYCVVGQAGFRMGALMKREQAEALFQDAAARIAQQLYDALRERRFARPSFLSLMMFRIQQRAWQGVADGSIDHRYWADHGWLEPDCEFYIPHRAGRLKVALARVVGDVISRFVT